MRKYRLEDFETGGDINKLLSSTMSGVQAGSNLGPWGAAGGAALGLTTGLIGISAERNAKQQAAIDSTFSEVANPFGNSQFRLGGDLLPSVKDIIGPSHEDGGVPIDINMNPSRDPIAEAEGGESGVEGYIFSDVLTDDNNISFAKLAKNIERDIKGFDKISKNSKINRLNSLRKSQEKVRSNQLKKGGWVYRLGGPLGPDSSSEDIMKFQKYVNSLSPNSLEESGLWNPNTSNAFDQYSDQYGGFLADEITTNFANSIGNQIDNIFTTLDEEATIPNEISTNFQNTIGDRINQDVNPSTLGDISLQFDNIDNLLRNEDFNTRARGISRDFQDTIGDQINTISLDGNNIALNRGVETSSNPSTIGTIGDQIEYVNQLVQDEAADRRSNALNNRRTLPSTYNDFLNNKAVSEGLTADGIPLNTGTDVDAPTPRNPFGGGEGGGNILPGLLKGAEFATLLGQAIQPPTPKSAYLGPNRHRRKNLAASLKIDPQALLNENTRAAMANRRQIRNISGTNSQMMANLQQSAVNEGIGASKILADAQRQNNQYRLNEIQTLAGLDRENLVAQDIFDKNRAARQKAIQDVGKSAGNLGEFEYKSNLNNRQNAETMGILNQLFEDFEYDPNTGKFKMRQK